jgi:hypothetical protein
LKAPKSGSERDTGVSGVFGLRVIAQWGSTRTLRVVALVALAVGMAWVVGESRPWSGPPVTWVHDVQYYYGAGERLNSGAQLYSYSPGDRQLDVDPFYFAGPFLYPPLLGVIWRPIAAVVPFDVAVTMFWLVGLIVFLGMLVYLVIRGGIFTSFGVLVLLVPLVWTAWSGNVSTVLTPLMIGSWLLLLRGRETPAGAAIGLAAVLKLTPAFLGWWLLVFRRWSAVRAAIVAGVFGLLVSAAGAGTGAFWDYLDVSSTVARNGGTIASLTSILANIGAGADMRALVAPIMGAAGAVLIVLLRFHPRAAWAVAIGTGVFASPVFNLTNVSLLLAAFVAMDPRFGPIPPDWQVQAQRSPIETDGEGAGSATLSA